MNKQKIHKGKTHKHKKTHKQKDKQKRKQETYKYTEI